mgnify:CR=1 FL=1
MNIVDAAILTIPEISDGDVISRFGDIVKDEYIDPRINMVKRARSLLSFWRVIDNSLMDAREGFHLAEKWGDEELRKQHLTNGRTMIKRIKVVEDELKIILPQVKNIRFLPDNEIASLPKWMLVLLDVSIVNNEK